MPDNTLAELIAEHLFQIIKSKQNEKNRQTPETVPQVQRGRRDADIQRVEEEVFA